MGEAFNAIYVDDEKLLISLFEQVIKCEPRVNLVKSFSSSLEALAYIRDVSQGKIQNRIDIVFTDIKMPYMDGIALAEQIQQLIPSIEIVFVTAYDSYSIEALKIQAVGYLLKPFQPEDFQNLITRYETRRVAHIEKWSADSHKEAKKLKVKCFGETSIAVKLPKGKPTELFFFYISAYGKPRTIQEIQKTLWPEFSDENAHNNFLVNNTSIKKIFAQDGYDNIVEHKDDYYFIPTHRILCDYFDFMKNIDSLFILNQNDLENTAALYTGKFCANQDWEFLEQVQQNCQKKYITLMYTLVELYTSENETEKKEKALQTILSVDSFQEEAYKMLHDLYFSIGKKSECDRLEKAYKDKLDEEF